MMSDAPGLSPEVLMYTQICGTSVVIRDHGAVSLGTVAYNVRETFCLLDGPPPILIKKYMEREKEKKINYMVIPVLKQ